MSDRDDQTGDHDEDRTSEADPDLGPMPDPRIEPGEPAPGGVDAVDDGPQAGPATPDLSLSDNPAVDHVSLPDEMKTGEDTSTQATRSEEPMAGEQESPA